MVVRTIECREPGPISNNLRRIFELDCGSVGEEGLRLCELASKMVKLAAGFMLVDRKLALNVLDPFSKLLPVLLDIVQTFA
jgi:hypothetical protein